MELGIVWPPTWLELARVGSSWHEFDQAQIFAQLEPCFSPLATSAHSSQLSPSGFVVVMWLHGRMQTIEWFSCELARLGGTVWAPADARFDFVTWLELGEPFGQGFTRKVDWLPFLGNYFRSNAHYDSCGMPPHSSVAFLLSSRRLQYHGRPNGWTRRGRGWVRDDREHWRHSRERWGCSGRVRLEVSAGHEASHLLDEVVTAGAPRCAWRKGKSFACTAELLYLEIGPRILSCV